MAKITWKGEDDPVNDIPGPSWNTWNGIRFPKGQPVEINDPGMIASARDNQFYIVAEGTRHGEKKDEAQDQGEKQKPPSLEEKAQDKERLERNEPEKDYDYREAEKVSGYSPKKKKGRPKKSSPNPGMATPDT